MLEHAPLKAVYIYFDTATYDEIKRDEKVMFWIHLFFGRQCVYEPSTRLFEGDNGSPIGFDWRHHGPSHWLLHTQWSRDHLLPSEVSLIFCDKL